MTAPPATDTIGARPPLLPIYSQVHDHYRAEIRDVTKTWDGATRADWERAGHLPRHVFADLGAAGLFESRWAAGRRAGIPHGLVLAEETASVSAGLGLATTLHCEVFCGVLERLRRTGGHDALLSDALTGRVVGCFAITEPRGGSDIGGVETVVRRLDGGWHLCGEKRYTTNAGSATHCLVLARCESGRPGRSGTALVVVPLDADGVEIVGYFPKAGVLDCDAAHLRFDARLEDDAVLGVMGLGQLYAMEALQCERLALSTQLLVAARLCIRLTGAYMRRREQFGRRLIDHQALRQRLADITAETWAAEAMLASTVNATIASRSVAAETAALKLTCARLAQRATDEAIQLVGGRGYTANYPFQALWRDVRLARIGGGTDEIMREIVASVLDHPDEQYDERIAEIMAADHALPPECYPQW